MKLGLYLIIIILSFQASTLSSKVTERELEINNCDDLVQWIFAELTEKNFDLLYKRSMNKFILGLYALEKDSKSKWTDDIIFRKLKDELFLVDPKAKEIFKQKFWPPAFLRDIPKSSSTNSLFTLWRDIQKNHPLLAAKIPSEFKLDSWDEMTLRMIDNISTQTKPETEFQKKLKTFYKKLNQQKNSIIGNTKDNVPINKINELNQNFLKSVHSLLADSKYDFDNICPNQELISKFNKVACTLPGANANSNNIDIFLKSLEKYIEKTDPLVNSQIDGVHQLDYPTNKDKDVTFCRRSTENLKYLVIHHSGTDASTTPEQINNYHINYNNWYMLGYNYLVSTSFNGAQLDAPQVFTGRPPEMQGAHTGSKSVRLLNRDYFDLKEQTQFCGNEQVGLIAQNMYDYAREIKENKKNQNGVSGNFFSLGIVVIGNYEPIRYKKVNGTLVPSNLHTEEVLVPTKEVIQTVGELSCQIQKKFPNIKTIVPHSYFKNTDCPGRLLQFLKEITDHANSLGCRFEYMYTDFERTN